MAFLLECEHCSQRFRVREAFVGRRFKCAKCGEVNEIEEILTEAPEQVPERRSDSELPVAPMLPPVAKSLSKKVKSPVADEPKKELDLELLTGRVGVLGQVDEEEEEEKRRVMRQVSAGFGLVLVLVIGIGIFINNRNSSPDKLVPKEFETYRFEEGQMLVDVPVDWEVKSLGGRNGVPATLVLKNSKVKFIMRANPRGTITGGTADTLNALGAGGGLDQGDTAEGVHVAHVAMGTMIANEYSGYEETPTKVIRPAGFGSARICRYEGGTPFGFTECGFRATVKSDFMAYRILITMPAWLMDDFESAAKKILASARPMLDDGFDFEEEDDIDDVAPKVEEPVVEVDPFTGEEKPVQEDSE